MKLESRIFIGVAFFLVPVTVVYYFWTKSASHNGQAEPVGVTALALTFGMAALIGFYLWFTAKRIDARPEDDTDAEIADGAGELGFFSPHSWWPLWLAGAAAIAFLSIVFGWWIMFFAMPLILIAICGWVLEYYVGEDARH